MKNIRYGFLFFAVVIFTFLGLTSTFSQVNVSLPNITRQVGASSEYINVMVSNISSQDNVTSFGFDLFYNPNVVFLDSVTTTGSQISGINNGFFTSNPYYASGDLRVGCITSSPITGSGILIRIKVHYKNPGNTTLSFTNPSNSQNTFKFNSGTPAAITSDGSISLMTAIPTLTLTAPNGGEKWQAKSNHNITWFSSQLINIKLEYSINNGTVWDTITSSTPASAGSYNWKLPDTNSTQALVRISDASNTSIGDTSNAVFTISQLNVISPNGGETWLGGSTHNITWHSANITNVKIEYSLDGGANWNTIATSVSASTETYSWTVPNSGSNQALIRISDASNSTIADTSNTVFNITAIPKVNLTSPNGGENWVGNSVHNITWTSQNVANVNIEFTLDNGTHWSLIKSNIPADSGKYSWVVPDTSSSKALVRISDASNSNVADTSNSTFTISFFPKLTVASPNGGEDWKVGTSHQITWSEVNVNNIVIEYSPDNGKIWNSIAANVPASSGTYNWTIPNNPTDSALVKIISISDTSIHDVSDSLFKISLTPKITVSSPNGGELWTGKTVHNIIWTYQNIDKVKIEYTLNNGTSWKKIADSISASALSYSWTVPDTSSTNAKVRITETGNPSIGDTSNAVFTISRAPQIIVTSPNGGEVWKGTTTHKITWTSVSISNVKIEYSLDNGNSWTTITGSVAANTGSYNWTVPDTTSTQVEVKVSDASDASVFDISDSTFTIEFFPKITVTSPNGAENWKALSKHDITWTSVNVTDVKIDYSLNGGTSWLNIVSSVAANTGKYTWTLPDTSSTQAEIKISDVSDSSISDISDNSFIISPITNVDVESPNTPTIFQLKQNYPNPFNPVTNITYAVPKRSYVVIKVYNILGKQEITLVNEEKAPGIYTVQFNGINLNSGVYFYRMQAGNFISTKKLILIK